MRRELTGASTAALIFILVVVIGALAACSGGAPRIDAHIAAKLPARGVLLATTSSRGGEEVLVFDADQGRAELHGAAPIQRLLPVSRVRELWTLAVSTRDESVPASSHASDFRRKLIIVDGDDVFEASFDGPRLPPSSAAGLVAELRAAAGLP